ncbi:hypothetical protein B0H21DRAFT_554589 [Amylocystis lapponica]|nr:hypothetical protein B0H21DRAFT_554589 [Amylocystis lapponica]
MTSSIAINTGASSSRSGPFAGFYDWQDARGDLSPAGSPSSTSSLSVSPSSPTLPAPPPPPAWATDAHAGIHYVLERFPTEGAFCIAPPFSQEPLQVDAGERVAVLEEVGEHALRVRRLRTGEVGLVPAWDVEGALERLARINMELNEVSSFTVEDAGYPFGSGRARQPGVYEGEATLAITETETRMKERAGSPRKSVVFAACERPVVFRYPSESLVHAFYGEGDEPGVEIETIPEEEEAEWWWDGWEEQLGNGSA